MSNVNMLDHLVQCNPYERFMIKILERLENLEDRMQSLDHKIAIVMDNIKGNATNEFYVMKITLNSCNVSMTDLLFEFINREMKCNQIYFTFGNDTDVQAVFNHNDAFRRFAQVLETIKTEHSLTVSHVSINNDVEFDYHKPVYLYYKNSSGVTIRRKLLNEKR